MEEKLKTYLRTLKLRMERLKASKRGGEANPTRDWRLILLCTAGAMAALCGFGAYRYVSVTKAPVESEQTDIKQNLPLDRAELTAVIDAYRTREARFGLVRGTPPEAPDPGGIVAPPEPMVEALEDGAAQSDATSTEDVVAE